MLHAKRVSDQASHGLSRGQAIRTVWVAACNLSDAGRWWFTYLYTHICVGDAVTSEISIVEGSTNYSRIGFAIRSTDKLEVQLANGSEDNALKRFEACRNVQGSDAYGHLGWTVDDVGQNSEPGCGEDIQRTGHVQDGRTLQQQLRTPKPI
jgi:hypothetical protein